MPDAHGAESKHGCRVVTAPGDRIEVRDAFGTVRLLIAVGPVDPGYDFAVVWACRPEEWEAAQAAGRDPECVPWPIEDVTVLP
jgi:hypothetical protein